MYILMFYFFLQVKLQKITKKSRVKTKKILKHFICL